MRPLHIQMCDCTQRKQMDAEQAGRLCVCVYACQVDMHMVSVLTRMHYAC